MQIPILFYLLLVPFYYCNSEKVILNQESFQTDKRNYRIPTLVPAVLVEMTAPSIHKSGFQFLKALKARNEIVLVIDPQQRIYVHIKDSLSIIDTKQQNNEVQFWPSYELRIDWSAKDGLDFRLRICKKCFQRGIVEIIQTGQVFMLPNNDEQASFSMHKNATVSLVIEPLLFGIIPVSVIWVIFALINIIPFIAFHLVPMVTKKYL